MVFQKIRYLEIPPKKSNKCNAEVGLYYTVVCGARIKIHGRSGHCTPTSVITPKRIQPHDGRGTTYSIDRRSKYMTAQEERREEYRARMHIRYIVYPNIDKRSCRTSYTIYQGENVCARSRDVYYIHDPLTLGLACNIDRQLKKRENRPSARVMHLREPILPSFSCVSVLLYARMYIFYR